MKHKTKYHVKSIEAVRNMIAHNYREYRISSVENDYCAFYGKKVKMIFFFLNYKDDEFSSVTAVFYPGDEMLEIKKDNGNKVRRYRKLFSPVA